MFILEQVLRGSSEFTESLRGYVSKAARLLRGSCTICKRRVFEVKDRACHSLHARTKSRIISRRSRSVLLSQLILTVSEQ